MKYLFLGSDNDSGDSLPLLADAYEHGCDPNIPVAPLIVVTDDSFLLPLGYFERSRVKCNHSHQLTDLGTENP